MDTQARRSGIPVPKSKSINLKKTLSKSNDDLLSDNNVDVHNQTGEFDVFTLLEENIALKENTETLSTEKNSMIQKNIQLERENGRLGKQLNDLKVQQKQLKDQLHILMDKFQKEMEEGQTIHNIQEQQKKIINDLMVKVRIQEEKHVELLKAGKQAKHRLEELAPEIRLKGKVDDASKCDIVTAETVEQLISEIAKIKTQMSSTELQLYEANEKIAELIENHHHMKEENENLKVENSNLTKVAKLMTNSMKESMDTSKRMEQALFEMKKRNEELMRSNKDAIDSPTTPKYYTTNDQVMHLKDALKRREAAHNERIVEMSKLMETTIETNTNDEINVLRIKLDVVEKELQCALSRAEQAENELAAHKARIANSDTCTESATAWPSICSRCSCTIELIDASAASKVAAPPPPPPPMPTFQLHVGTFAQCATSLKDGISAFTLNNQRQIDDNASLTQSKPATGMDALIAQLRDGTVTLRKSRRRTESNAALQEMFATLELSRKQNRSSRLVVDGHIGSSSY